MARLLLIVAFAVVLTSSVSGHEVGGLTFEVPDNDEFCLYEKFRNASVYIIDFKVYLTTCQIHRNRHHARHS